MINSCADLMDQVERYGFLPLLNGGIEGFSADEMSAPECGYRHFDDGGWEWPLWEWKGAAISEGGFAYGKFFGGKAGFVSREWWPVLCSYRRSRYGEMGEESVEGMILSVLQTVGSMTTKELRMACGFTGKGMRGVFDGYVTRLQMACRVVTADFTYPLDRHGKRYGWGWAVLTTPEQMFGRECCRCEGSPDEWREQMVQHLRQRLPEASERALARLIG